MDVENQFKEGKFCFLTNLYNYLVFNGIAINEVELGGILGYMGFYYSRQCLSSKEILHGRSGDFEYLIEQLQQRLKKPLQTFEVKWSDNNPINYLSEWMKENNTIVVVRLNNKYLKYSIHYNKCDFRSYLLLVKIYKDEVVLFDNGIKHISYESFMNALFDSNPFIYYIDKSELGWKTTEKNRRIEGMKNCIKRYNCKSNDSEYFYGFEGMYQFINDLKVCTSSEIIYNFYFQMSRPGGVSVARSMMALFLDNLNQKYELCSLENGRQIYLSLETGWRKISNLLFRLSNDFDEALKQRIISRIYNIIQLEHEGIERLESIIRELEERNEIISTCK